MIAWICGAAALAAVATEAPPAEGVETVVALTTVRGDPASGQTVRVVHRPGLAGEREVAIGISDGRGRVRWTPELPGVARIRAGDQVQWVRVEPAHVQASTPVVLALLAVAALTGMAVGFTERRG